jgi:hypothetical protein
MSSSNDRTGAEPVAETLPNGDREWRLGRKLHRPDGELALTYTEGGGECWLKGSISLHLHHRALRTGI